MFLQAGIFDTKKERLCFLSTFLLIRDCYFPRKETVRKERVNIFINSVLRRGLLVRAKSESNTVLLRVGVLQLY